MTSISGKLVNNVPKLLKQYEYDKDNFYRDVKDVGLSYINKETPVISGKLKSGNSATITADGVDFWNNIGYYIFVYGGTIHQAPNPFTLRGLTMAKSEFVSSLIGNLSV